MKGKAAWVYRAKINFFPRHQKESEKDKTLSQRYRSSECVCESLCLVRLCHPVMEQTNPAFPLDGESESEHLGEI